MGGAGELERPDPMRLAHRSAPAPFIRVDDPDGNEVELISPA